MVVNLHPYSMGGELSEGLQGEVMARHEYAQQAQVVLDQIQDQFQGGIEEMRGKTEELMLHQARLTVRRCRLTLRLKAPSFKL